MAEKKPDNNRAFITFLFVVILGYVLGFFLKKMTLGLVLGLVLGLLGAGMLRRRR